MSVVKCCVLAVDARAGTGTQSFSGVVRDASSGELFTPTFFLFQAGYAAANTVASGNYPINLAADFNGADTGLVRSAGCSGDVSNPTGGFKAADSCASLGDYSILDYGANAAFAGTIYRKAKITNIRSGGFDIQYDQNGRTGDVILITCFGGDGLTVESPPSPVNDGTHTTSATPHGLFSMKMQHMQASGLTSTGAGGFTRYVGWASRESNVTGCVSYNCITEDPNYGGQRTDTFAGQITNAGAWGANKPIVSAWGDTSYTVANGGTSIGGFFGVAFCGAEVVTAAGTLTQPLATGDQVFSTGINAKWIILAWGGPSDNTIDTPTFQSVRGWSDGVNQVGFWTGESALTFGPFVGARYLSTSRALQWGTPNGLSTTFDTVARVTALTSAGSATLTWDAVDGSARQILWFAVGEAAVPVPPEPVPQTVSLTIRRERISSHVTAAQRRVFWKRMEIDFQPGIGNPTAPGDDPQAMVRWSDDGGKRWSNEHWTGIGKIGRSYARAQWYLLGSTRDRVIRLIVSDPVTPWVVVDGYIDIEGGES